MVIKSKSLKLISFNIFIGDLAGINKLMDQGLYGNRTDAIRYYIREGLKLDFKLIKKIGSEKIREVKKNSKIEKIREVKDKFINE